MQNGMCTVEWEATSFSVSSAHPESQGCRGVGYVSMLLPCGLWAEHKDVRAISLKVHYGLAVWWAMQANDQVLSNTQRLLAYLPE